MDIEKLIAEKQAEIAKLKDQITALQKAKKIVEDVSGTSGKSVKKTRRAKHGAKKAKVLGATTKKPQRMRDIAEKAGVSTSEAGSVLQSAVKRGEVKKGRGRGTYLLA